jgi:hypothetical protein
MITYAIAAVVAWFVVSGPIDWICDRLFRVDTCDPVLWKLARRDVAIPRAHRLAREREVMRDEEQKR